MKKKAFFQTVLKKKETLAYISEPRLPRKRRAPARYEVGEAEHWYPQTLLANLLRGP